MISNTMSVNLLARAYHRILKLARTIADLGGARISSPCIWRRRCTFGRPKLMMG